MDPLTITSSIIGAIRLSAQVVGFIGAASGATKERRRLREEVQACDNILQQLKDEADDSEGEEWPKTLHALQGQDGPVCRLSLTLNIIKLKLEPKDGQKMLTSLKWPFERKQVEDIIGALEREKALLTMALTGDHRRLVQGIRKSVAENNSLLWKLIGSVETASKLDRGRFTELRDSLAHVQKSQAGLRHGIDHLNDSNDHREASERRRTILEWLTPVDYATQQHDFLGRRQPETGQWLIESTEFGEWLQTDGRTLFCPGIPGAGKTILTSIVIGHLYGKLGKQDVGDGRNIGIAYLYCNFRRQHEQGANDLLASLLKQLSQALFPLPEVLERMYEQHEFTKTRPSLDDISRLLQTVAALYTRVFVIIDALDECQATNGCRARLLTEVLKVQANCRANIFATSRFIPDVTKELEGCPSLEIRASQEDVRRYLDGHMYRLPSFVRSNQKLQEDIKSGIVYSAQGMFLLAQLHLDSLIGRRSPKAVQTALAKLQSSTGSEVMAYDSAYLDAMERIEGQVADQEQLAKQVLSWITCATRPLTITELQHALAVEVGESALDEDNLPQAEDMVSVCAGLVTIDDESGIIRLVHYTTQEYFERTQDRWFPDAESEIATICITYLSFDVFGSGPCDTSDALRGRLQSNPLYDYAAKNWGVHARQTPKPVVEFLEDTKKVEAATQALIPSRRGLSKYTNLSVPQSASGLHLAAYFELQGAARALLQRAPDVNVRDSNGSTPLSYAASEGREAAVRLLLEHGADIEARDDEGATPLLYASGGGRAAAVRLLLAEAAEVDARDSENWTPLICAAIEGHAAVVRLLLESGAAIEGRSDARWTPLMYAAHRGHAAVARLLLESGADVDAGSEDNWRPLLCAADRGHEDVVRLLLENGADVKAKHESGATALKLASRQGHTAIVRLLLEKGADMEADDVPRPVSPA